MKITSTFANNTIPDVYGMNTGETKEGLIQRSFPFIVTDILSETKYIAFSLLDYDTDKIVGFPWIHWSVADIPVDSSEIIISDNFSLETNCPQGMNSFISMKDRDPELYDRIKDTDLLTRYSGPRPKSGIHNYRLQVFALRDKTNLSDGFYLSELMDKVDDLVIDQTSLNFRYQNKL